MRRFLAAVAAASFVLAAGSAHAASHVRLTLSVTGYKVLYGHQVTVAGHVTDGRAGQQVTILARRYDMASGKPVANVVTSAGGRFRYFAHPTIQTSYWARMGTMKSQELTIGVSPVVTAKELGNGKIRASVEIGRNVAGRSIKLQHRVGGVWQTVDQRPLDRAATATFAPRPQDTLLRMAFSVNEAGKGYLGATTHPFRYHTYKLTLLPQSLSVLYGSSVMLAGHLVNGRPGEQVAIMARPYGRSTPIRLATVTTKAGGFWRLRVTPRILTTYQATWSTTERSARVAVDVKPLITAKELGNGDVRAHVEAAKSFHGRSVKLQHRVGGMWQTVDQQPLDRGANVTFAPRPQDTVLRIAFSVNQAGKGYLGATTHAFRYHAYNLTLLPQSLSVLYGSSVVLAGHLVNGRAGEPVKVYARPFGRSTPTLLATVTTKTGGFWRLRVAPRILTTYQATWSTTERSARVPVDVKPVITAQELANGDVRAHVQAGKSFHGRFVKLQRLMPDGVWATVMQAQLDRTSTATFRPAAPLPTSRLRVALSVNEAGNGYLGGYSHTLGYRAK